MTARASKRNLSRIPKARPHEPRLEGTEAGRLLKGPSPFDRDLEVARAARALAKRVGQLPDIGAFDAAAIQALGPSKLTRGVTLAVAPDASEPATRTVEVRVTSVSGKASTVAIKSGTNAQVAAFLRRVTTPGAVLDAINVALEQQRRDEGAAR